MTIILKNITNEVIIINDISVVIPENSEVILDSNITNLNSNDLIKKISSGSVILNNGINDLNIVDAIKFLVTGNVYPLDSEGKLFVHETSRLVGCLTYWTGKGDNPQNILDIGNGEKLILRHNIGDPLEQIVYIDFNTINNRSDIHEGYFIWDGAKFGDTITVEALTKKASFTSGINTNYNLYNNYLIIPAAGNGNIELLSDITSPTITGCLVQTLPNEKGIKPPSFWKADYDNTLNIFTNILPAPYGDGDYNIFAVEIPVNRFINHIPVLGQGFERLQSADSTSLPHGVRLKIHIDTLVDDHNWSFGGIMTLHREKTV